MAPTASAQVKLRRSNKIVGPPRSVPFDPKREADVAAGDIASSWGMWWFPGWVERQDVVHPGNPGINHLDTDSLRDVQTIMSGQRQTDIAATRMAGPGISKLTTLLIWTTILLTCVKKSFA